MATLLLSFSSELPVHTFALIVLIEFPIAIAQLQYRIIVVHKLFNQ